MPTSTDNHLEVEKRTRAHQGQLGVCDQAIARAAKIWISNLKMWIPGNKSTTITSTDYVDNFNSNNYVKWTEIGPLKW